MSQDHFISGKIPPDFPERSALLDILKKKSRYPLAAYLFVSAGVQYTVKACERAGKKGLERHVTGAELLRGILQFAVVRFGFLAPDVFRDWNFERGRDIGNVVYAMIGAGILAASPNDRIEDFDISDDLPGGLDSILKKMDPPEKEERNENDE